MIGIGSVVEETVDDLQLSSFAGLQKRSLCVIFFNVDAFSPGQGLLDLGRCGGCEEIRHLEGWFQETMILI